MLIKNGTIVTAENEFVADVYIKDGKITKIGENLEVEGAEVIDAKGKYVLPGGVDQHVHFSFQFNGTSTRGFETSNAAACGGTTTVIEFVNQLPGKSLISTIDDYRKENAEGVAMVDYSFHGVITDPESGVFNEIKDLPAAGYPTVKLFMAYKGAFYHADDDTIYKAMKEAREAGVTIMVHAENADLIDAMQKECIAKGHTEPYSHVVSRPPVVEEEAIERAINIAKLADAPLYVVHVSTIGGVNAIKEAYDEGYPIYGETCTHYLTLDKENLAKPNFEGAKYVCSPALRGEEEREYLWKSVKEKWLNAISSDHCGFDWKEQKHMGKDDFRGIPNGAPGLENRLGVLWTVGVEEGRITRSELVDLYATTPAKNNGIGDRKGHIGIGYDADITIYDPNENMTISNEISHQGVDYNSYEGFEQKGVVDTVLLRGEVIVKDGEYVGNKGDGEFIPGKAFGLPYENVK